MHQRPDHSAQAEWQPEEDATIAARNTLVGGYAFEGATTFQLVSLLGVGPFKLARPIGRSWTISSGKPEAGPPLIAASLREPGISAPRRR